MFEGLEYLFSDNFEDGSMGSLIEVLESGGAPSLEILETYFFESLTMQELGRIYRTGRFAKLKELELVFRNLMKMAFVFGWTVC